jgi:hypothetical protein
MGACQQQQPRETWAAASASRSVTHQINSEGAKGLEA